MLEVTQLHLWRGERHVLRGLSFSLGAGQVLQLLWPNGAGKTSLLRCIAGFLQPESGHIRWEGHATSDDVPAFCRDLAYLGHDLALKGDLTVEENLRFGLAVRRPVDAAQILAALTDVGLGAYVDEPVRRLSAGQQRRVALARLSLWGARLWLLDEPVSNLDAAGQALVIESIGRHLARGGAALLSTHQPLPLTQPGCRNWLAPGDAI